MRPAPSPVTVNREYGEETEKFTFSLTLPATIAHAAETYKQFTQANGGIPL